MMKDQSREKEAFFSGFSAVPEDVKEKLYPDGLPFYHAHDPMATTICVCLHGFTATPYEVRPVADACFSAGLDTVAPLLPCHGYANLEDQHEHIIQMTLQGIIKATRAEIAAARRLFGRVFVYGQSMGGALALLMAEEGLVDACAMTAPAIKLPLGSGLGTVLFGRVNVNMKKKTKNTFYNASYPFNNSIAGVAVQHIALQARKNLDRITCPVLVCHSHNDSTISPIVPLWIQQRARGPVEVAWFDKSDHTMPLDVQGKEVSDTIAGFFTRQLVDDGK
jgi:carboxylesterase